MTVGDAAGFAKVKRCLSLGSEWPSANRDPHTPTLYDPEKTERINHSFTATGMSHHPSIRHLSSDVPSHLHFLSSHFLSLTRNFPSSTSLSLSTATPICHLNVLPPTPPSSARPPFALCYLHLAIFCALHLPSPLSSCDNLSSNMHSPLGSWVTFQSV